MRPFIGFNMPVPKSAVENLPSFKFNWISMSNWNYRHGN